MAQPFDFCLDLNLVAKFFTTEALQKPKDVFQKVHTPIDRIEVDFYREANHGKFTTEEQLIRWILSSKGTDWHNRIFTLVGETGSGKSELAQAIYHAAKDSGAHVPILISRSLTRLRDIVRLLQEHAGQQDEEEIGEITNLSPEIVCTTALLGCLSVVDRKLAKQYGPDRAQELRTLVQQEAFSSLIRKAFLRYKQDMNRLGAERTLDLLDYKWYEKLVCDALPWLNIEESYKLFREAINEEMKRQIQLGDLGRRLRAIAERYKTMGRRPVLILEDLTSFGFVKEDLLDILFDVSQGNFDVVIGWTTGFEAEHFLRGQNDQAMAYMVERMKGRFLTTSAERASYFLEQHHGEVVRRYLDAVRRPESMAPLPTPFFPLNRAAVTRIYQHLIDDKGRSKRTPRLLIDVVGQTIRKEAAPWRTLEELPNLAKTALPDHLFPYLAEYEDAVLVLKWYGHPETGKIDRKLVERLGLTWPAVLAGYLTDEKERTEERATDRPAHVAEHGTKTVTALSVDSAEQDQTTVVDSGRKRELGSPPAPRDPLAQDRKELQQWLRGGDYSSRQRLKDGLHHLVDYLTEHDKTFGTRLLYQKERVPVYMAGTKDLKVEHPAIRLTPSAEWYSFYLAALTVTNKREAAKLIQEDPKLAPWVLQLVDTYQQEQRTYLVDRLGVAPDLFVFHAWQLVKGLSDGFVPEDGRPFFTPTLRQTPLVDRVDKLRTRPEIRSLMAYRHTIRGLFVDWFFGQGDSLDLIRYRQTAAAYDSMAILQKLNLAKRIDIGFRIQCEAGEGQRAGIVALDELVGIVARASSDLRAFPIQDGLTGLQTAFTLAEWADGLTADGWKKESKRVLDLAAEYKVALQADWQVLQTAPPEDWTRHGARVASLQELIRPTAWGALITAYRIVTEMDGWKDPAAVANPVYLRLQALHALIGHLEDVMRDVSARRAPAPLYRRSLADNKTACQEIHAAMLALLEG
jgi:hypothetical protein